MSDETYATRVLQRVDSAAHDLHRAASSGFDRAQIEALAGLYTGLAESLAAQSREIREYIAAERTALDERDEALRTVDELREELTELRGQLDELAALS